MLMRTVVDTMYCGNYRFVVELDTGAETGANQRTVWVAARADADAALPAQSGAAHLPNALADPRRLEAGFPWHLDRRSFGPAVLGAQGDPFGREFRLRDFYFEEANGQHICTFCREFALDEAYRQRALVRETRWAKRNALFVRNLLVAVGEDVLLSSAWDYDRTSRDFFHWVDAHVEEILALVDYQYLKEVDGTFQPRASELDPFIRPAVEALNWIPGVTTQFSCQGVSGKVRFQGRELLTVSPHEEYAYVSFAELVGPARDAIAALLPLFPSITDARVPCNFALKPILSSTGDNLCFRTELIQLAERVLLLMDDVRRAR
jgi:hypothetical protein